ncbi:nuclear factor 7, brain [Pogona vitticeps]
MAFSLAEDLLCPICLALFQEPHMLSCGHNFCLACLKSCVPEGTCPECRQPFERGDLACNRALGSLARKARRLGLDQEPPLPGDAAAAAAFLGHFCEEHDEPLKLFCKQDRVPICVICRDLPEHRGHDFLPTKNAVDYAQKKLKPYLKSLKKKLRDMVINESDQQKEIASLESCTEDTLSYIGKEFGVLYQILHEKEEDIKRQFQELKELNLDEMQDALTSFKDGMSSCTKHIASIKAALATTDRVAFLKDFKDLIDEVKEGHFKCVEDDTGNANYEEWGTSDEESDSSDKSPSDSEGEKSAQAEPGDNKGPGTILLEEDKDDSEEEEEEEEEGVQDDRLVPVMTEVEEFTASLDFEAWKLMLKSIEPKED